MRIAIITDIHHRVGGPAEVLAALEDFVDEANRTNADVLLDLGDRLRDVSPDDDRAAMRELAAIFARFNGPRLHLMGNHDVINLGQADHAEILGVPLGTQAVTVGAVTLVAWQPDVRFAEPAGFAPATPYLDELAAAVANAPGRVVVATHYPVSGQSMAGNRYFEQHPEWAFPPDNAEIRELLSRAGRCALWLSGHIHQSTLATIDGTVHVCLQSLSEPVNGRPSLASAQCWVGDEIVIEVGGREPMSWRW